MTHQTQPIIQFCRLIDQARLPQRADRSAIGTLPTRAYRYCEAARSATGFGWWAFPPLDMQLLWDGSDIFWRYESAPDWLPLMPSAQFPHFSARFDEVAPPELAGCAPPFLTALPEPGALQIWTGVFMRTAPGWHVLVRGPANLPVPGGFSVYEGIIETDHWFGPLFTNMRLTRTDTPVRLRADFPLIQVQPLRANGYADAVLDSVSVVGSMSGFSGDDWRKYQAAMVEPQDRPDRPFGAYAVGCRRRRAQAPAAECPAG